MRIEELIVTGFGRFRGRRFGLAPGLNVLYGPNESGKSTLQQFLLAMLYGMQKRGQRRAYTDEAERLRPWDGGEYRGALLYQVDDGRRFRVERQFDPGQDRAAVYDADTGADLTAQFPLDRRKELLFAEAHLNLPEEAFRSTAWVGQLAAGQLEVGRELVARVANLQESGREDLSVRAALAALDDRAKAIGTERAPARPYGRVARALQEKRAALERAQDTREQVRGWEARLQETRAVLAELEAELDEARRRLDWALLAEAEARLERLSAGTGRVRELQETVAELAPFAAFPSEQLPRLRRLQAEAEEAGREAAAWRERLDALAGEAESLRLAVDSLPGMALYGGEVVRALAGDGAPDEGRLGVLHAQASRLAAGLAEVEAALAPLEAAVARGADALARVDEMEAEISRERGRVVPSGDGAGWVWLGAGGVGVVAAAALGWLGYLAVAPAVALGIAGVGVAAGGWLWSRAQAAAALRRHREELTRLERAKAGALAAVGVSSPGEIRTRVIRYEQLAARRDLQQGQLAQLEAERDRLEAELDGWQAQVEELIARAMGRPAPPAAFRQAYHAWQEAQERLAAVERESGEARRRLEAGEERASRAAAEAAVLLAEAGVTDAAAFEAAALKRDRWQRARDEAAALQGAVGAQLGGADLEGQVGALRDRVFGDRPAHLPPAEELQAGVKRLEGRRADLTARASDLGARVETALAEVPDTADLKREIEALQEQKAAYDEELAAIDLASATLTEVAGQMHREFAPRLNQAMGQSVAALTGGKYRAVRVDEAAAIRVLTDDDRTVALESLSGGTADQLYLGLRLALLDLLTGGQERVPLFLDDPFVQYDDARAQAAMEFLKAAARERQVVLLTCHRREVALADGAHILDLSEAASR